MSQVSDARQHQGSPHWGHHPALYQRGIQGIAAIPMESESAWGRNTFGHPRDAHTQMVGTGKQAVPPDKDIREGKERIPLTRRIGSVGDELESARQWVIMFPSPAHAPEIPTACLRM